MAPTASNGGRVEAPHDKALPGAPERALLIDKKRAVAIADASGAWQDTYRTRGKTSHGIMGPARIPGYQTRPHDEQEPTDQ